jgi:hypothetical protein
MAKANIGDLAKHRGQLLDDLKEGRPDLRLPETAWPAIEGAVRRCRASMNADLDAEPKKKSKADLRSIISSTSKIIRRFSDMKGRQLRWIFLELGEYPAYRPKYAHERGSNFLEKYLNISHIINKAAKDALVPISRTKKFERNAASRLILELDALWQAIRGTSGLNDIKRSEGKYFKYLAFRLTKFTISQDISQEIFDQALKRARSGHSDESEASEQLKELE